MNHEGALSQLARIALTAVLSCMVPATMPAQVVHCALASQPWQYGFRGACVRQGLPQERPDYRSVLESVWPDDTVTVFAARDSSGSWIGHLASSQRSFSFQLAQEHLPDGRKRDVLRNVHSWAVVRDWRIAGDSAWFSFDPAEEADPSPDDVLILERALVALDSVRTWDRADDRNCVNDAAGHRSLYCLIYRAVEEHMGRFHFRQPALQVARAVVRRHWRARVSTHPLMDFNNHSQTTMADVRHALETALAQARREAAAGRQFRASPSIERHY